MQHEFMVTDRGSGLERAESACMTENTHAAQTGCMQLLDSGQSHTCVPIETVTEKARPPSHNARATILTRQVTTRILNAVS